MPEKISMTIIRRRLHSMVYFYKIVANKIVLTHNHMLRRVDFVKKRICNTMVQTKWFIQMNASSHRMVTIHQEHGQRIQPTNHGKDYSVVVQLWSVAVFLVLFQRLLKPQCSSLSQTTHSFWIGRHIVQICLQSKTFGLF